MAENNFSLSDLVAAMGGGMNGLGGNNWLVILIVIFMLSGGGWGFNRGNGDYGQYATAASQQEILFGQHFQNLDNKMDRLGNGIADATFALNNSIKDGNAAVAGTVVTEGRNAQSERASQFCETQKNIDALRFDMSNYKAEVMSAVHAEGEATRSLIQQNKIETLQEKVRSLELGQAMCNVVRYPNETTYTAGGSPFCNCNRGCGCGNI